eukprot:15438541-Alexandrium_andersonii.AAC.1
MESGMVNGVDRALCMDTGKDMTVDAGVGIDVDTGVDTTAGMGVDMDISLRSVINEFSAWAGTHGMAVVIQSLRLRSPSLRE